LWSGTTARFRLRLPGGVRLGVPAQASSVACAGGTGGANSVSSSHRGTFDLAEKIDTEAGDELVIVYDSAVSRCARVAVDGASGCDLR
jgi:hypothetical protein